MSPTDPVAIVWTGGTTGLPKGAWFDHECLKAMTLGAAPLSAHGDRRLSPLPFAHVGFMTRAWDEWSHRITTVIAPTPWTAASTLDIIGAERVTVCQGVPTQYRLMFDAPSFELTDTSHLRIAGIGAARIPPELVREMRERLGCPVVVRYASTAVLAFGTPTACCARVKLSASTRDPGARDMFWTKVYRRPATASTVPARRALTASSLVKNTSAERLSSRFNTSV